MKLVLAILAYLIIAVVLGWGVLKAVGGSFWLLIVGFVLYVLGFAIKGCLTGTQSHPDAKH